MIIKTFRLIVLKVFYSMSKNGNTKRKTHNSNDIPRTILLLPALTAFVCIINDATHLFAHRSYNIISIIYVEPFVRMRILFQKTSRYYSVFLSLFLIPFHYIYLYWQQEFHSLNPILLFIFILFRSFLFSFAFYNINETINEWILS